MNICRKPIPWLLAMLYALLCLAGCSDAGQTVQDSQVPTIQAERPDGQGSEATQAHSTAPALPSTVSTGHITQDVSENFRVDADVVGYPADGMASVYTASPKLFTQAEIEAFAARCGTSVSSTEHSSDAAMRTTTGTCANGNAFWYIRGLEGVHNHPYTEFFYHDPQRSGLYLEYPIYRGEDQYLSNAQYSVGWMFTEPKDFAFATAAQAERDVREALEALGLSQLTLLRTLYADHDTMAQAGQFLATDERFAPIVGTAENNGYTVRDDWSQDDDAYIFSFGFSVSGVPMSYLYDTSDTGTYTHSEVVVWYTADGISYLNINTPWVVEQEDAAAQPVLSPEEALEIAKEKYTYDLVKEDMRIKQLALVYRYRQDRDRWLLRPVWVARLSYSSGTLEGLYEDTYIDAFTGMEW